MRTIALKPCAPVTDTGAPVPVGIVTKGHVFNDRRCVNSKRARPEVTERRPIIAPGLFDQLGAHQDVRDRIIVIDLLTGGKIGLSRGRR